MTAVSENIGRSGEAERRSGAWQRLRWMAHGMGAKMKPKLNPHHQGSAAPSCHRPQHPESRPMLQHGVSQLGAQTRHLRRSNTKLSSAMRSVFHWDRLD